MALLIRYPRHSLHFHRQNLGLPPNRSNLNVIGLGKAFRDWSLAAPRGRPQCGGLRQFWGWIQCCCGCCTNAMLVILGLYSEKLYNIVLFWFTRIYVLQPTTAWIPSLLLQSPRQGSSSRQSSCRPSASPPWPRGPAPGSAAVSPPLTCSRAAVTSGVACFYHFKIHGLVSFKRIQ